MAAVGLGGNWAVREPRRRWGLRIAVILPLCGLLLWVSIGVTLNMQFVDTAPVLASRWWPFGAEVLAGLGASDMAGAITPAKARHADRLARLALAREPVLASAARLLGLTRASLNGERAADPVFAYAQTLSRRDMPTQLWLLQRRVDAGDVRGALVHYDVALRTNAESYDLLLPVLASASARDDMARALIPFIARRPVWSHAYFERFAATATNPATLFGQARAADLGSAADSAVLDVVINRLVTLGRPDLGHALLPPDAQGLLRDGGFEGRGGTTAFDWWLRDEPDLAAYRDAPADDGRGQRVLHILAKAGNGGEVARQLLLLSPGRYRLDGSAAGVAIRVGLTCDRSGAVIASAPVAAPSTPRRFTVALDVPAGCTAQWLRLTTPPAQPVDGWIDALSIVREGEAR